MSELVKAEGRNAIIPLLGGREREGKKLNLNLYFLYINIDYLLDVCLPLFNFRI